MACLSSITKPRQCGGPGPLGLSSHWGKNCLFEVYLMTVSVTRNALRRIVGCVSNSKCIASNCWMCQELEMHCVELLDVSGTRNA